MKIINVTGILSALLVGQCALAQVQVDGKVMERGVYYKLGDNLARRLNIDLDGVKSQSKLQPGENLVVKLNEETNDLNIAIFDNEHFATARIDIMQGN